ncbi:MAG: shikimate kinase [Candidatus Kryptoniota bacterium]
MDERRHIIYLAGFMGSGKTTIGPKLAHQLECDFVDVDDLIEKEEGISIARIFEKYNEQYFRDIEKKMLAKISESKRNIVVALGGGTMTMEENRNLIHKEGILVYLKTDPEEIFARIDGKQDRPMLLAGDGTRLSDNELRMKVTSLMKEREKHYLEANIIVNTSNINVEESVEQIVSKLSAGFFGRGKDL